MKTWLVDKAFDFVKKDKRYIWLGDVGTYDHPLGPVHPRSENVYKAEIIGYQLDVNHLTEVIKQQQQTISELREEGRALRAIIDKHDKAKYLKENFR